MSRVRLLLSVTLAGLAAGLPLTRAARARLPVVHSSAASEHLATPFGHVALQDVVNALDPAHAAAPVCTPVAPVFGG